MLLHLVAEWDHKVMFAVGSAVVSPHLLPERSHPHHLYSLLALVIQTYLEILSFKKPSERIVESLFAATYSCSTDAVTRLMSSPDSLAAVSVDDGANDNVEGDEQHTSVSYRLFSAVAGGPTASVRPLVVSLATAFASQDLLDLLIHAPYAAMESDDIPLLLWLLDGPMRAVPRSYFSQAVTHAVNGGYLDFLRLILEASGPVWEEQDLQQGLEAAADCGDRQAAEMLLQAKPAWTKQGLTVALMAASTAEVAEVLLWAAGNPWGDWELSGVLTRLASDGPGEVIQAVLAAAFWGWTVDELEEPLEAAVGSRREAVVQQLLAARRSWRSADLIQLLYTAATQWDPCYVQLVLKAPCNGSSWPQAVLAYALSKASNLGHSLVVDKLLEAFPGGLSTADLSGALMGAIVARKIYVLECLLKGATLGMQNGAWDPEELAPALAAAVQSGVKASVEAVLKAGVTDTGRACWQPKHLFKAAQEAVFRGAIRLLQMVLDAADHGLSAWHAEQLVPLLNAAVSRRQVAIVQQLLKADVWQDIHLEEVLELAAETDSSPLIQAVTKSVPSCHPTYVFRALAKAASKGSVAIAEVLLRLGKGCWSPAYLEEAVHAAAREGDRAMLQWLLDAAEQGWQPCELQVAMQAAVLGGCIACIQKLLAAAYMHWQPGCNLVGAVQEAVRSS